MATVVDSGPPLKVRAEPGDSLCLLAIEAGFEHCQRVRDANGGQDFVTKRHLEAGDIVVIPERDIKHESQSTDTTSTFVKLTSPPFSIRFVHGSRTKVYADDDTLLVLNVSNVRTDIDFPTGFGFDSKGDRDVDTRASFCEERREDLCDLRRPLPAVGQRAMPDHWASDVDG